MIQVIKNRKIKRLKDKILSYGTMAELEGIIGICNALNRRHDKKQINQAIGKRDKKLEEIDDLIKDLIEGVL